MEYLANFQKNVNYSVVYLSYCYSVLYILLKITLVALVFVGTGTFPGLTVTYLQFGAQVTLFKFY